jgi:hypothetical protein
MKRLTLILALLSLVAFPLLAQEGSGELSLTAIGTYDEQAVFDEGVAEIVAYYPEEQTLVVVNSGEGSNLDFLEISDPANPTLITSVDMTQYGAGANSVAVANGIVASAVEAEDIDANGVVVFLDASTREELGVVEAGVLPDMVGFTPDGSKAIVANEGEPSDEYDIDPLGSVTIINVETFEGKTLTFEDVEIPEGVRVFGLNATAAQDLEPEYVAVSPDGSTAYVSIQENNAVAIIDMEAEVISAVVPLGFKDYSLEENAIDVSNEDGMINIQPWPIFGMYQPDTLATFEIDGEVFVVTANEGDARDYDGFSEEARVADVTLDAEAFPNAAELQAEDQLGRINMTTTLGDTDGDGDYDELYVYGGRSFSILDAEGNMIYDSANDFEVITAELAESYFNSNGFNDDFDGRSDDKGAEPEAAATGVIGDQTYAFIGLERTGGVMVYNVSDPMAPVFVTYVASNIPEGNSQELTAGDQSPEGMVFISAEQSPTGNPLLVVSFEVSGTVTIFEISEDTM